MQTCGQECGVTPRWFYYIALDIGEGAHLGLVSEQFSGLKVYNREAGWSSWYNDSQGGARARNVVELNNPTPGHSFPGIIVTEQPHLRTSISWDNTGQAFPEIIVTEQPHLRTSISWDNTGHSFP